MKVNINQKCTVILKERGVDALLKYYSDIDIKPPKHYVVGDKYIGPLWDIMHLFGSFCYMGPESPIETEIELKDL